MAESGEVGFGEELRRSRLVREVSLESIASATKISTRYLEALERADFARLPAPVFTRGFIRAYASYLGLDPEEMVNAYLSETMGSAPRNERAMSEPVTAPPRPAALWLTIAVLAVVGVVVAGALWSSSRRARPAAPRATALPPAPVSPFIREIPPSTPSKGAEAPPTPASPLALDLRFREDCWIEVFADNQLLFSGLLRKGDARRFEARNDFRLTLGNARAADVSVNGRELPPLGGDGEVVRDLRIDAAHLNELVSRKG